MVLNMISTTNKFYEIAWMIKDLRCRIKDYVHCESPESIIINLSSKKIIILRFTLVDSCGGRKSTAAAINFENQSYTELKIYELFYESLSLT